jgi:tetrahydromethanopterin S-methyltransferase subunit A
MTLNKAQFEQFVENYVLHIVDGMDTESLECMVSDLLFKEYVTYTEEEILAEIKELYDDEVAQDLLESVDPHVPVASILKHTELLSGT